MLSLLIAIVKGMREWKLAGEIELGRETDKHVAAG